MATEPRTARTDPPQPERRLSAPAASGPPAGPAPLSVAQEALWYQSVLFPQEVIYNEIVTVRRQGPLDAAALARALAELIARHEILRTTFDVVDGEPIQIVHPPPEVDLPTLDLSALTPAQADERAMRVVADVSRVPYDVRRGPLLRSRLIRFPGSEHRLYLALHHMVFDGISISRTVLPELAALYGAFAAGRAPALAPPVTQYGDFARWEQARIDEPRARRSLRYWRAHLAGASQIALPTDRPRDEAPRFRGAAHGWEVPAPQVARLRVIAQESGGTLFQALGAAWALLLGRWADRDEVRFATPADLRRRPELESLVGYCITPLIIRVSLAGDPTFSELIRRTRNDVLDGLDHLVPFERLVRELHPEAGALNPFYQTMLVLEPAAPDAGAGWSLTLADAAASDAVGSTRMDLELQLDERADGRLAGRLIFDRDLYDRGTVVRLADQLGHLIEAVCRDPTLAVSAIPLLDADAADRQLVELNATTVLDAAGPTTIAELVARRVARDPSAVAVRDAERTLTYGELQARAEAVAERLRASGLGPGDVIAICGEPGVDLVVAALASLRAGVAHRLVDPALDRASPAAMPEGAPALVTLGEPGSVQLTRSHPSAGGRDPIDPSVCCLIDSAPDGRAVAIDHAGAVNLASALAGEVGLTAADTVLVLPQLLYRSTPTELWPALGAGAGVVLASREQAATGASLSRVVRRQRATLLHADPGTWRSLIDSGLRASRTLRALVSPGAPERELAAAIASRCRVVFGGHGTPRAGLLTTLAHVRPGDPPTIGRPLANCRAYVLDDNDRPVPVGIAGSLVLAGVGVGVAGAAGAPPSGDIIADPFADGLACRTGERARWLADGRLQLV